MRVIKILNPRYLESGAIDCEVLFEGMREFVPYTATSEDTATTGRRVREELQSGKWGEIAPFTVTPELIAAAKDAKKREIEAWRTEQEAQSFTFEWNGHTWNAGPDSLARLSPVTMVVKSEKSRDTFAWNDASNQAVLMTIAQAEELVAAMAQAQLDRNNEIYMRQRELKDALDKLESLNLVRGLKIQ
ncbi:MAG: P27p57 [Proteobacteria bacterium]|nr:P27p57 [Pseudomonadota bacterium]